MTAVHTAPAPPAADDQQPYNIRTTISPAHRDRLIQLQSEWQGITPRQKVSLPDVSRQLVQRALDNPALLQVLLDELRGANPPAAKAA